MSDLRHHTRGADRSLLIQVRELVPESQAYMDLLAFERKLDATIQRKRLEIQEVIRRPMKQRRKLRLFISHRFFTPEPEGEVRCGRLVGLRRPLFSHRRRSGCLSGSSKWRDGSWTRWAIMSCPPHLLILLTVPDGGEDRLRYKAQVYSLL